MKKLLFIVFFGVCITLPHSIAAPILDRMPSNSMQAEEFSLPDVTGEMHSLSEYEGKYLLVNFWATSCVSCRAELLTLDDLREQLKDKNFEVLAIHAGDDLEGVEEILEVNPVGYRILMDMDLVMGGWGVPALPTSYILDPQGRFHYRAVGTRVWNAPFMVDFLKEVMERDQTSDISR